MTDISIIIPTYNRVDLLPYAINSVKNQSFLDWELIVVDDCSTDNTKQVVSSYMYNDSRIRYAQTDKNSGNPVKPRNLGVQKAKGKYIAFLDSDDSWNWEKNKLEFQYFLHSVPPVK